MSRLDYRDLYGGLLVSLTGAGALYMSLTEYQVGTLARMGPGYFPALVSGLLIVCGLLILIPALFRAGPKPKFDLRPLLFISLSILVFGLLLMPMGLIFAVICQTLVAGLSDRKLSWKGAIILAIGLSIGATLLFKIGLGMTFPLFPWSY